MSETISKIIGFLEGWGTHTQPNTQEFIDLFIEFLTENKDPENYVIELQYVGQGDVGPKFTLILKDNIFNSSYPKCGFEITYNLNHIVVYTDNHNGFWVDPYIDLNVLNPEFLSVRRAWIRFLCAKFGI